MEQEIKKKRFKVPHTYVIIFTLIIITAVLTYVIPAGQYQKMEIETETGTRTVVDPASYANVDSNPAQVFDVLKAFPKGLGAAQGIVFFIFIVGGSFNVINKTGAIEAGISKVALGLKGAEALLIPIIVFIFSIGGGTIGMAEEAIVFVPIGIALARSLGYDAVTGMAIVALGAATGFVSGFMNPFTVGVAQGIAGIPMFSGIGLRLAIWAASLVLVIGYIYRYANKVKKDPTKSIVYDLEQEEKDKTIDLSNIRKMTGRDILVLLVFFAGMGLIVFGVFKYGWYITEIASIFLAMGIVSGIVARMSFDDIAKNFISGAKDMATGALVVGLARGLLVIMEGSMIIDTIVYSLASVLAGLPKAISAVGMLIVQSLINFAIPSGSGQAATTMPIMAPLADVLGLTRQTAVLAYQFGDGISNSIIPTSGVLLANLSVAKIKYEQWFKFVAPLILLWTAVAAVFMVIAVLINYA
ncbi:putative basic amino acid antiporter YfcC [Sedimentibacter hydroxybenzoicus DSM 7310]|uniref:Basic amino acid antiporter YfcC n=1 Tax=Sedimentibacter hydroxybenzoicus DSM 7310 TaxID=1123245 RepID=A0A974BIY4_SEDHY|nr:YfcC family protein [Sedimentibacter hydroxybenzoicus]NYB73948.1 putative basic amino acid antiporter YfcC [Sedimentibacter hydroxybenzoicus DSM 7310]